jgi:hypothetical protein
MIMDAVRHRPKAARRHWLQLRAWESPFSCGLSWELDNLEVEYIW